MKLEEIKSELKGYFIYKNGTDYELGLKKSKNHRITGREQGFLKKATNILTRKSLKKKLMGHSKQPCDMDGLNK